MRSRGTVAFVVAVALLAGAGRSLAAPQQVASDVIDSSLASDARGDAVVGWENVNGAYVALARPGGRFGRAVLLSGRADSAPLLAMDARGDVVAAWTYNDGSVPSDDRGGDDTGCCERVRVAELRANGRIVAHETLPPGGYDAAIDDVAITPNGSAVAVLYDADVLRVRLGRFGHGLADGASFARAGGYPAIASLQMGAQDAYVAYSFPARGGKAIREARVAPSGRILQTRSLGTLHLGCNTWLAQSCDVLYNRDGAGRRSALFGDTTGAIRLATWPAAGGRARVQTLLDPAVTPPPAGGTLTEWAFAPSGHALVAWCGRNGGGPLHLAVGLPASGLTDAAPVAAPAGICAADGLSAAIDSRGQALVLVLAMTQDYYSPVAFSAIERSAAGVVSVPWTFASDAAPLTPPDVVVDERGRAIVVWSTSGERLLAQRLTLG